MAKPKIDEYMMHYRNIVRIMKRHKRILVYALPGEGKTTILRALKAKYESEGWNFYDFGVSDYYEPFIYELPHADIPEHAQITIPDYDIVYVIQYSREFKEAITGVSFGDEYRPMAEYVKAMKYKKAGRTNLGGRRFKTIDDLKKALQGEDVDEL